MLTFIKEHAIMITITDGFNSIVNDPLAEYTLIFII